jgi:hypothetical protein
VRIASCWSCSWLHFWTGNSHVEPGKQYSYDNRDDHECKISGYSINFFDHSHSVVGYKTGFAERSKIAYFWFSWSTPCQDLRRLVHVNENRWLPSSSDGQTVVRCCLRCRCSRYVGQVTLYSPRLARSYLVNSGIFQLESTEERCCIKIRSPQKSESSRLSFSLIYCYYRSCFRNESQVKIFRNLGITFHSVFPNVPLPGTFLIKKTAVTRESINPIAASKKWAGMRVSSWSTSPPTWI